jgi:hypothetical protein
VEYAQVNGHCSIPSHENTALSDGSVTRLGMWLTKQQGYQMKGQLKPERQAKLQLLVDKGKMCWRTSTGQKKGGEEKEKKSNAQENRSRTFLRDFNNLD